MIDFDFNALKYDSKGLIPAIIQEASTLEVLMLGYMNSESLQKTCETGETWFWSRSRQEFWNKGATSGNIQKVVSIAYDCDGDTLLIKAVQMGAGACHTGTYSCFYRDIPIKKANSSKVVDPLVLQKLQEVVQQRKAEMPEGSYTTSLFKKGLDTILKKVGEEATEVVIASKDDDREHLVYELADLCYHLTVLLAEKNIPLEEVLTELEKRFDVSGFTWKERQAS